MNLGPGDLCIRGRILGTSFGTKEEGRGTRVNGRERRIVQGAGESLVPFRYLGRLPNLVALLFSGVFMGPREAALSGVMDGWSTAAMKILELEAEKSWKLGEEFGLS